MIVFSYLPSPVYLTYQPRLQGAGKQKGAMAGLTNEGLIILSCSPYDRNDKQAYCRYPVPSLTVLFC